MPIKIFVNGGELYNNKTETFINVKPQLLTLEHSLVSVSKWESKWHKPFLSNDTKTEEETIDYIRCMTITQNVDPNIYAALSNSNYKDINDYISDSMTATWFRDDPSKSKSRRIITSEVIYYWMITQNIPFKCETWHLNRLLTLIRVCSEENAPKKKLSRKELASRNRNLNAIRRARHNTRG